MSFSAIFNTAMKTKALLFLIFAVTVFAFGTLITVLFNTAPIGTNVVALLYISLLTTLFGLIFFATYGFFYLRLQAMPSWQATATALRLGSLGATLLVLSLMIRSLNLLNSLTFLILIILTVATELMMRRRSLPKR
jgi:hypothetical protein